MFKLATFNAIDLRAERDAAEQGQVLDDLERPIPAPAAPAPQTFQTMINLEHVREFHPRKYGRSGTRIVFLNGAAQVVAETFDEVTAAFNRYNN